MPSFRWDTLCPWDTSDGYLRVARLPDCDQAKWRHRISLSCAEWQRAQAPICGLQPAGSLQAWKLCSYIYIERQHWIATSYVGMQRLTAPLLADDWWTSSVAGADPLTWLQFGTVTRRPRGRFTVRPAPVACSPVLMPRHRLAVGMLRPTGRCQPAVPPGAWGHPDGRGGVEGW